MIRVHSTRGQHSSRSDFPGGDGTKKPHADNAKLVNQIVERIHAKITLGEYVPGDRLRQEILAAEFNVSRTPIREALRLLEAKE